ncbi:hypothetical protein [Caulobacter hibisci]|uniref:Uncharacterized protein n=1 Tax=Caulobacter hibisci TaxID=2035993 RepID=A0ABS0SUI0_9CAUL|nr:hypothetical protein [Caulobacter hibisci]MBI1683305.1 hypothetical protein [Caulobacter hibisci]
MTRSLSLVLALSALTLSACGDGGGEGGVARIATARPPLPAWSEPLVGKRLSAVTRQRIDCQGVTDVVTKRFTVQPVGAIIEGWGWDKGTGTPLPRVLLVEGGLIVGAGDGGRERVDVPKALPQITSSMVGWQAVSTTGSGHVTAYGFTDQGVCSIGEIAF